LTEANPALSDALQDRKTIFRGAGLALAGFLVRPLSRIPFLFIVGRIYGASEFGRYVFAVALFEAIAAFCRLGLKDTLFRFLAEHPDDQEEVLVEALVVGISLAVACAVVTAIGAPMIGTLLHKETLWRTLGFLAPALPVFVATDLLFAAARYHRAVSYEVVGRSLIEPLMVTLGALALGLMGVGARGLVFAYMGAQLTSLGVAILGVARRYHWKGGLPSPDRGRIASIAARSAPTGFADCIGLAFNATGAALVGNLVGDAALGVYGMAQNLETALSKVRQAFDMIVVPVVSQGFTEKGADYVVDQLRLIGRSILTAQLPLLAAFLLFGPDILGLFGKSFPSGATVLVLLALAAVIDGVGNLAQVPLFLSRPKVNLAIAGLALSLNLGLGFLLIPRFGAAGMGVAICCALVLTASLRQILVARRFGRSILDPALWRPIASVVAAGAAAELLMRFGPHFGAKPLVAALLLAAIYFGLVFATDPVLRKRLQERLAARRAKAA
jgi:O-antigen/teichoic acid export membrane protein